MARIPWRWEDLVEGTVQFMALNPNEGASPQYRKALSKSTSTAPGADGRPIIFEGADEVSSFNFKGAILFQAHYEFLLNAWRKRHPVRLTDDLGRSFVIYMESFEPERILSRTYPWRHKYTASAVIVEHA